LREEEKKVAGGEEREIYVLKLKELFQVCSRGSLRGEYREARPSPRKKSSESLNN